MSSNINISNSKQPDWPQRLRLGIESELAEIYRVVGLIITAAALFEGRTVITRDEFSCPGLAQVGASTSLWIILHRFFCQL